MGAALARGLLAAPDDPLPAIDDRVIAAARRGAWFAFNLSGGKDSTASAHAGLALLNALGHPRDRRIAIHADLGRAEWRSTPAMVAAIADRLGLPLLVVSRSAGDMVSRWEQRFLSGKRRYEALETYNLIGPWSSASLRFCTSELKVQVIGPDLARRYRGETIVSVIGLRRDESPSRRATPVSRADERFAKPGNAAGTRMLSWHPAVDWSANDVFGIHKRHGLPLHEAYVQYRTTRLSCAFCVLASAHDLAASAAAPDRGGLDLLLSASTMARRCFASMAVGRTSSRGRACQTASPGTQGARSGHAPAVALCEGLATPHAEHGRGLADREGPRADPGPSRPS